MISLARALSAEALKTKRTLTLTLTLLAPLAIAFLEMVMGFQINTRMYPIGGDGWTRLYQHVMLLWNLLMLPLFITLEMGLLGAIEHNNKTWKQLYALPVPRWSIYAAKQIIGLAVIALSMVIMLLLTILTGLLLGLILPESGFNNPLPWSDMFQHFGLTYLAAWLMVSIHMWVSLRWPSFVLAMSVGIVATVAGVLVVGTDWIYNYYPWVMSAAVTFNLVSGTSVAIPLILGLGGGILLAFLGGWDVIRRDVL